VKREKEREKGEPAKFKHLSSAGRPRRARLTLPQNAQSFKLSLYAVAPATKTEDGKTTEDEGEKSVASSSQLLLASPAQHIPL
jgi:hypothetical protein